MEKRRIILTALISILAISALYFLFLFTPFSITGFAINTQTVESTNDVGQHSSIALDSNGKVHISHYDVTNTNLRYCNNTAGSWSCAFADTGGAGIEYGWYSSIAIDSNNKVHISHLDNTGTNLRYCNNTAGTWSCVAVDTANVVGPFSSIAIDKNNKVHISHEDNTNGDLRYCNNTAASGAWSCITVETGGTNYVGQFSSIAIDSNNKVHISHYDSTSYDLRYCNNTAANGAWSCAAIETIGSVGIFSSIAIDSNNKVHISYQNGTGSDLKYCNNTAGTWSCTTIESTNQVGYGTSIAIDSNNKVHISHFDVTNNDLRYCNNIKGSWSCVKLADGNYGINVFGRGLAIKKGRIADSTSFSNYAHMSWDNQTPGDLIYTNISIDSTPPSVTINSPLNQSYATTTITFNVTAIDNLNSISSCWYTLNNGVTNYTMSASGTNNYNSTNSTMAQGSFTTKFYCNDTYELGGNINNTEQVTFFIDTINPYISIVFPLNNSNFSYANVNVNYTVSDANLQACWYSNDTYLINTTITCGQNITTIIWSEGQHNVTVWANDTANNVNKSSVRFTIDTIKPNIQIVYPSNNTNTTNTGININYTVSDSGIGLSSCWYSNDSMTINTTLENCVNITNIINNLSDGFPLSSMGITFPYGIAFDTRDNSFWIVDNNDEFVYHLDSAGNNLSDGFNIGSAGASNPISIAFDTRDNSFWITDNLDDFIYHFNSAGDNQTDGFSAAPAAGGSLFPYGITFDTRDNSFWIVDNNDEFVYHFDNSGNNQTDGFNIGSVGAVNPWGIAFDTRDNSFWIVDYIDYFVYHFNSSGDNQTDGFKINSFGAADPRGLAFDTRDNSFWITDYVDEFVYHFNKFRWNEGQHNVTIWANDTANNVNKSSVKFTIDSVAPNVSAFYNVVNNGNYSGTIVVNVSVNDVTIGIDSVYFNITNSSNKQVNFTKASNPGGIYYNISIDTTKFTDGKYNITVYANDTLNNLNNIEKISITFDNTAPTASFTCSPSSITVGQTVTCSCSPSDATSGVNNSATSYTTNPSTLNTGTFTLTCTFADMAGNSASAMTTYIVELGGGGGIVEIVTKVQPTETISLEAISPEQPAEVVLTNPEIDLTKFIINVKETVQNATLTITEIDISEEDVQILAFGITYQAFEIDSKGIDDINIKYAVIEFKINKTWLSEQGSVDDVMLLRKQEKEWSPLDTTFVGEDSGFYYFSAISPGFSTFVVFVGTQKCILGEIRCFDNQLQVCLGNYMWRIIEECKFGCEDNKCISMPFRPEKILFLFGIIVGLISAGIIIVVYFIYKNIRKKKKEKREPLKKIERKEKIIESKKIEKPIEKIRPLSLNLKIKNLREEIRKRGIREVEIPKEKKQKRGTKIEHRKEIKLLEGEIEKLKKETIDGLLTDSTRTKEINKALRESHYDSKKLENLKKEIREKGIKGFEIYKKGKNNYTK